MDIPKKMPNALKILLKQKEQQLKYLTGVIKDRQKDIEKYSKVCQGYQKDIDEIKGFLQ